MVERSNHRIEFILKMVTDDVTDWKKWLWALRMVLNSTKHALTAWTNTLQSIYESLEHPWLPVHLCGTPVDLLPDRRESKYVH